MRSSNDPAAASTAPQNAAERARFIRRQEALAIGWLRSLGRSANASSTAPEQPAPKVDEKPQD